MSEREPLRSGACPDYDNLPGGWPFSGDGLAPGQAARVAAAILSEPETGKTGEGSNSWNHVAEIKAAKKPRRNRHLDGYGDERGRY